MDSQGKYTKDPLSQYINPERIEKAPEGFTSRVMSLIEKEKTPVRPVEKFRKRAVVPYLFSAFILILTILTFFLPGSEKQTPLIPVPEFLHSIKVTLPEIDLSDIFRINLPSSMIFGLVGILLLSFLDKALFRIFHREK